MIDFFQFSINAPDLGNYVFAHLSLGVVLLLIAIVVISQNPRNPINRAFSAYSFSIAWWSLFTILLIASGNARAGYFWDQVCLSGAIFIPVTFLHFVLIFTKRAKQFSRIIVGAYLPSLVFLILNWGGFFIASVKPNGLFNFYTIPSIAYHVYITYFSFLSTAGVLFLFRRINEVRREPRLLVQAKWLFATSLIGYLGGATNFLLVYGINLPFVTPIANYSILIYGISMAYIIFRYSFLDIRIIIKRTIVFAGLFGVIMVAVGIVTALTQSYVGQFLGMGPMARQFLSLLIAISLFDPTRKLLVNLTDKFLFQKKYDYHQLLKDASRGMSNIESLEHLLGLVVHFVTMKMRVKNAAVLMREGTSDQYHLVYQRGFNKKFLTLTLYENDPLIHYLESHKEAVDIERIKEQVEAASYKRDKSEKAYDYEAIRERMNQLQASCCVPSFLGRELRNILMLGEKKSGEYYSNEDLNLLYTLAQESSIAIENARLYDEALRKSHELEHINEQLEHSKTLLIKALQEAEGANKQLQDTQAQLIHEQKMATLGRLAASVGHEVNNPLTILSMNVSRVILKHRKNQDMKVTEILDVFDKMEKNIERIKAVVNTLTGLLKKSEKGKFEPLSLKLILEETLPLVQFQTYLDNLSGTEVDFNVPGNVPLIRGDLERLQEVFLNLFINAYHAMAGKRHRKIGVLAEIDPRDSNMVAIHFRDNGSGMTEEIAKKIFNYGFTTKPPGKGSGLGLYMCKYIIELHGGTIAVDSKLGEGTTFTLTLPIYSETPALKQ